jgi:hypothetical protein
MLYFLPCHLLHDAETEEKRIRKDCVWACNFFKDWALSFLGRWKQSFARDLFEDLIPPKPLPHFVCGAVTLVYRIWLVCCLSTAIVSEECWNAAPFCCDEIAECLMWPILCLNSTVVQDQGCAIIIVGRVQIHVRKRLWAELNEIPYLKKK